MTTSRPLTKILFISPQETWVREAMGHLHKSFTGEISLTGKEGQLALYRQEFSYVFIDLRVTNNSALEVIRYISRGHSKIKVFAFSDAKYFEEQELDEGQLLKLGVQQVLKDLRPDNINDPIKKLGLIKKWEEVVEVTHKVNDETEKSIEDSKFTRVKIEELFRGEVAVFDFYIRLGSNRYVKILNKGEKPSDEQMQRYFSNGAQFLYFLASERLDFIGHQNDILSQEIGKSGTDSAKILKSMKSVSDKFLEEVVTNGIQPYLVEEGKSACENVHNFIRKDQSLSRLLSQFEEFDPAAYSHSFLVCFFSALISKNLEWVGDKSRDAIALGAMFHDIGLMSLPPELLNKKEVEMSLEEKILFHQHTELGRDALKNSSSIAPGVLEIVKQHHELGDGSGYPDALARSKIFPMAKIVGLADAFSECLIELELSPLDGLKEFLGTRDNLLKYDPDLVRNLIKGFIPEKKS